jgi:hypothetical protein
MRQIVDICLPVSMRSMGWRVGSLVWAADCGASATAEPNRNIEAASLSEMRFIDPLNMFLIMVYASCHVIQSI